MFRRRLGILGVVYLLGAAAILFRLADVQLVHAGRYQSESPDGRVRVASVPAVRGAIFDAEGTLLARDRCAYVVEIAPSVWRENSLVAAIVDAQVLLADAGAARPSETAGDMFIELLRRPENLVRSLLALPADVLATPSGVLRDRGRRLLEGETGLLRSDDEMDLRLRSVVRILLRRAAPLPRAELVRLSRTGRTLGDALDSEPADLAQRLWSETRSLESIGEEIGSENLLATWQRLAGVLDRERQWVRAQIDREVRDLALLETFGTPLPAPASMGPKDFLAYARSFRLPFRDAARAREALALATALLGGGLPTGPSAAIAPAVPFDAIGAAERAGIDDVDPLRLRDAWWEHETRKPGFDRRSFLDSRRERELRGGFRGARRFVFGRGARTEVAFLVEGPGGLARLGFALFPAFVREEAVLAAHSPGVRLLVGDVTVSSRRPRSPKTIEGRLDDRLSGEDGEALVFHPGRSEITKETRHGESIRTTLHLPFQRGVEEVLVRMVPPGQPAAVAVVDARTGAILALATHPPPSDPGDAVEERSRLSLEDLMVRRLEARGESWASQRIAFLKHGEAGSDANDEEAELLAGLIGLPRASLLHRREELRQALARASGVHRAIDSEEHSPPGSVFKAITILGGLEAGIINARSTFDCHHDPERTYHRCHHHGAGITPFKALEKSCNAFCYDVAAKLGSRALADLMGRFGLYDPIPGVLDGDPGLRSLLLEDDALSIGIGEGSVSCSPVRAAGVAASLARGRLVHPHLVLSEGFEALGASLGSPENFALIREGMRAVVREGGTTRGVRGAGLDELKVAAKTGTADYDSLGAGPLQHAWFVGFAPATSLDSAELAFAVMLPHVGDKAEGADAAPIAREVIEAFGAAFPKRRWW